MSLFDDFPTFIDPSASAPAAPAAPAPTPVISTSAEMALAPVVSIVSPTPLTIAAYEPPLFEADWRKHLDIKDEKVDSTLNNARIFLTFHEDFRGFIRWNDYAKRIEISGGPLRGLFQEEFPEPEEIVSRTQDYLAHTHKISISFSDLSRRVVAVARLFKYDPLTERLIALAQKWDGLGRIEELFITYFGAGRITGAEPTAEERTRLGHLRRIGKRWMLGAVERALRPGCKVDNVLVLEGLQGTRKTSALEALGGEFYCSTQINLGDKDSKMIASSNWLIDLPDTNFMKRTNRGFVTQRVDTFRPPFGASVRHTPRRCVLVGSMNPEQGDSFQYFEEEERRYWPVRVSVLDLRGLMRDCDQLWGEAAYLTLASATCPRCLESDDTVYGQTPRCEFHRWWLDTAEEKIALAETADRVQDVPWKLRIQEWWLDMEPGKRPDYFTVEDIAIKALGIAEDRVHQTGVPNAIGMAVRSLGFLKRRVVINGAQHWVYKANDILQSATRSARPVRVPASSLFDNVLQFDPTKK